MVRSNWPRNNGHYRLRQCFLIMSCITFQQKSFFTSKLCLQFKKKQFLYLYCCRICLLWNLVVTTVICYLWYYSFHYSETCCCELLPRWRHCASPFSARFLGHAGIYLSHTAARSVQPCLQGAWSLAVDRNIDQRDRLRRPFRPCSSNAWCVQVSVGVKMLPVLSSANDYVCVFATNWTVTGTVSPNQIKCRTPPPHLLAPLFHSRYQGTLHYTTLHYTVSALLLLHAFW